MAKSTSERQRAYRQRHLAEGDAERLNVVVSVQAKRQLERLARHRGVTQRETLETMLAQAERRATANLRNTAGYYSVTG
jgi:macrodomain Ter protein organizer (MatP/YcbG family)